MIIIGEYLYSTIIIIMIFTNKYTDKEMKKAITIQKVIDKVLTTNEAMSILQKSERQIYRYISAYKFEWPPWLIHWLKDRPSNYKAQRRKLEGYKHLVFKKKYHDFWPTLLAEELSKEIWYDINHETLRLAMIRRWRRSPKQKKIKITRQNRERKSNYWCLIQFDWSYHDWLENWNIMCLLCAIDDATWKIIHMKFSKSERLEDLYYFRKEYIYKNWKPEYIYVDKHASYKVNYPQDQFNKEMITRFERWMNRLWIWVIFANCPEGKWRVERWFKTHQDRMIKKMRLRWIKTYEEANLYLSEYITEHNEKYSVEAKDSKDTHKDISNNELELFDELFAKESNRTLRRNWTIEYNTIKYQIPRYTTLKSYLVTVRDTIEWKIELYSWEQKLNYIKLNR